MNGTVSHVQFLLLNDAKNLCLPAQSFELLIKLCIHRDDTFRIFSLKND